MSKFKFELNRAGVKSLMKSEEMQAVLAKRATEVRNRAGDGYEQNVYVGKTRANVTVRASTYQAKKDNLRNNTLLKAVHP